MKSKDKGAKRRDVILHDETAESKALAFILARREPLGLASEMFTDAGRRALFSAATQLEANASIELVLNKAVDEHGNRQAVERELDEAIEFEIAFDREHELQRAVDRVQRLHRRRFTARELESMQVRFEQGQATAQELASAAQAMADAERDAQADDSLDVVELASVEERPIEWIWPPRIARGKVTLFAGDPECAKSLVSCDIAARVSSGLCWPDSGLPAVQGDVLMLLAEDDVADTVAPRLREAGADLSRIRVIDTIMVDGRRLPFELERDLPVLRRQLVKNPRTRLVVIDPVNSFLGRGTDSHNDASVRQALGPLRELAERFRVAVILITHNHKGGGPAVHRPMGSVAFVGLSRSAPSSTADPREPTRFLMLRIKNNLAKDVPGLAYEVTSSEVGDIPRITWSADPIDLTAKDIVRLERQAEESESDSKLVEAEEWLKDRLSQGPSLTADVMAEAGEQRHAARTIERARTSLKVEGKRVGKVWWIALPGGFDGWTPPP